MKDVYSTKSISMDFTRDEILNNYDVQIEQRAEQFGLSVGEYLKRLAVQDIRAIDNLEVEEKYQLK